MTHMILCSLFDRFKATLHMSDLQKKTPNLNMKGSQLLFWINSLQNNFCTCAVQRFSGNL